MNKQFSLLLALALMLSGCGVNIAGYPWAPPAKLVRMAPAVLTVTVPTGEDDIMTGTLVLLEAKLKELSEGQLTLETVQTSDMSAAYRLGGTGLYLMSGEDAARLDEGLAFATMPFLFDSQEQFLGLLNNAQGVVRGAELTKNRLEGEILGVYYRGTRWLLNKGTFYDEVGFYNSMAMLEGSAGNSCFEALGCSDLTVGSQQEILADYAENKTRYCEITPEVQLSGGARSITKNLELTCHRYDGWWMLMKDPEGALSGDQINVIREAYAYTHGYQNDLRRGAEAASLSQLEVADALPVRQDTVYTATKRLAQRYYMERYADLGIPKEVMVALNLLRGAGTQ